MRFAQGKEINLQIQFVRNFDFDTEMGLANKS